MADGKVVCICGREALMVKKIEPYTYSRKEELTSPEQLAEKVLDIIGKYIGEWESKHDDLMNEIVDLMMEECQRAIEEGFGQGVEAAKEINWR